MYHILFFPTTIYQKYILYNILNIYKTKKRSNDIKQACLGYLTFYNKNGIHYKVKVIFFFILQIKICWLNVSNSFFIKIKRPQIADRGKPDRFVLWWRGGEIILQISSRWNLVSTVFAECHAFSRLKMHSVNFDKG